jgi:hypothetical protein
VHDVRRERRQADRDVVGAVWRAVSHSLAAADVHRLAHGDLEPAAVVLDDDGAGQDVGPLVELRALLWL